MPASPMPALALRRTSSKVRPTELARAQGQSRVHRATLPRSSLAAAPPWQRGGLAGPADRAASGANRPWQATLLPFDGAQVT